MRSLLGFRGPCGVLGDPYRVLTGFWVVSMGSLRGSGLHGPCQALSGWETPLREGRRSSVVFAQTWVVFSLKTSLWLQQCPKTAFY